MASRKRVNGVPVVEGLTDAEYMRARRAPNTVKAIMDMGKKPDPGWLKMVREARVYVVLGVMMFGLHVVSDGLQVLRALLL